MECWRPGWGRPWVVRLCQAQQRMNRALASGPIQVRGKKCLHFFVCKLSCPGCEEQGMARGCACRGLCLQVENTSAFQTRNSSGAAPALLRSALAAPAHAGAGCSHASVVLFRFRCPREHEPTRPPPLFTRRAAWAPREPGVPLPVSGKVPKSVWRLHARQGVILGWKPMMVAPLERGVHSLSPSRPNFPGTRSPGVSPEQPPR